MVRCYGIMNLLIFNLDGQVWNDQFLLSSTVNDHSLLLLWYMPNILFFFKMIQKIYQTNTTTTPPQCYQWQGYNSFGWAAIKYKISFLAIKIKYCQFWVLLRCVFIKYLFMSEWIGFWVISILKKFVIANSFCSSVFFPLFAI